MLFKLKIVPWGLLPLVTATLLGCSHFSLLGLAMPEITPIGELKYSPEKSDLVKVQGKVGDRVPFLDNNAYLLQDNTGSIWVRTNQNPPAKGQELLIEGKLEYQSIPLEQQEFGGLYITEVRQLEAVSPTPSATPSVNPQPSPTPSPVTENPVTKPSPKPLDEPFLPHKEYKKD